MFKGGMETYIFVDLWCVEGEVQGVWNDLMEFWFRLVVYPSIQMSIWCHFVVYTFDVFGSVRKCGMRFHVTAC